MLFCQQQELPESFPTYGLGDKVDEEGKEESGKDVEYFGDCWQCRRGLQHLNW